MRTTSQKRSLLTSLDDLGEGFCGCRRYADTAYSFYNDMAERYAAGIHFGRVRPLIQLPLLVSHSMPCIDYKSFHAISSLVTVPPASRMVINTVFGSPVSAFNDTNDPSSGAVIVNFPTVGYEDEDKDEERLPWNGGDVSIV
jgi:hypothetical protein